MFEADCVQSNGMTNVNAMVIVSSERLPLNKLVITVCDKEFVVNLKNVTHAPYPEEYMYRLDNSAVNTFRRSVEEIPKTNNALKAIDAFVTLIRRGLLRMVSQRRSLLDYLKRKNSDRYSTLIGRLSLRR